MEKYKLKKEIMSDLVCGVGLASTWRVRLNSIAYANQRNYFLFKKAMNTVNCDSQDV